MNNQIQIFSNSSFGDVRIITTEQNEPLFCLADVCQALDLGNPSQVKTRLDDALISNEVISDSLGRQQVASFITEDGLYDVILDSRKPSAKQFRKWVTSEVLPSIRKTGGYIPATEQDTPEVLMARALQIAAKTIAAHEKKLKILEQEKNILQEENEKQAPKVAFANAIVGSTNSILVGELATLLKQNGVNIGQNRLFEWLRDNGYLCKAGERYNLPTQLSSNLKIIEIKKGSISVKDTQRNTATAKITPKGIEYFFDKFQITQNRTT